MHARSGEFRLDPGKVDDAIESFKADSLPQYKQKDGYKGFTLMVNRQSGRVIGVSFWEGEADLHASDDLGSSARENIHEQGGGKGEIEREEWEVVVDDMA